MIALSVGVLPFLFGPGCSSKVSSRGESGEVTRGSESTGDQPPESIQRWMDRLTVAHAYDPETGFIVAKEVVELPEVLAGSPGLQDAVVQASSLGKPVIVFATADRCAPCQQFKKSALRDDEVIAAFTSLDVVVTHIEVDREPDVADRILGSRAIPMTYLLRDGVVSAELRGQRTPDELLRWLDENVIDKRVDTIHW